MESPGGYPESPLDQDDVVYPCKGCGEILEEGKAFELAGNRWHIDCFRCNTCGTLLDSDANLLLLGDGSLICNNCTYSCNHCGNKIEDLAILTGDQAFCANCFRCRNCKRKIENLRYARTSQGIFCMSCHESLMARRRKKSKKPPPSAGALPKTDKSLPALPPSAVTFTPDLDTPLSSEPFSDPPTTDVSPHPQHPRRQDSSPANFRRDASPASTEDNRKENLTLPASTYKESNHSETSDAGEDGILLPFALDPNPAPGPSPLGKSRKLNEGIMETQQHRSADGKPGRDYFNRPTGNHREILKENRSRSSSTERQPKATPSSPHIAYQEKGRQASDSLADTIRKRKESAHESPSVAHDRSRSQHASSPSTSHSTDAFRLQDVPKSKKAEARRGSKPDSRSPSHGTPPVDIAGRMLSPPLESVITASPTPLDSQSPLEHRGREDSPATSGSSYSSTQRVERPTRGDSLNASSLKPSVTRKDMPSTSPTTPTISKLERKPSLSTSLPQVNGNYNISSPIESPPVRSMLDPPAPPQRSAGRPPPPSSTQPNDTFTSPRAPPPPPPLPQLQSHRPTESMSTVQSENSQSMLSPVGGLPRYSAQVDFSMDEDFARLLSNQENQEGQGSVLRRVSNAMSKHGRSFSDRGSASARGHKKWPTNGSIDISSPTVASPDSKEESVNLRNELRRAQQRIAELEAEKNGLQETVNSAADIKQANTMLREKRNTMAVLDTQREMVIRELEIMTEHLKRAKEDSRALDINQLKSDVLKDFANSLQKLKDQLGGQIEDLIAKRTELTDEISNLIQMKDKGFQEYESLSAQNTKLSNMNRDLIESIQRTLKENKQHNGNHSIDNGRSANGLGISNAHHKGKSDISVDIQGMAHEPSYSNLHEADSEATLAQPQVVNIRKTGKPTKFNWKKGSQATIKNVTKGFKGAFAPSEPRREEEYNIKVIGTPYGSVHSQPDIASMTSSMSMKSKEEPASRGGWFGGKGNTHRPQQDRFKGSHNNNSSTNLAGEDSSVLFGSDLTARCEFEKRVVPAIVSRCIEEVELRGMDIEGIYRKSGAASQVNQVKSGFEKSNEYDISDPDLDIHAVTSALKGYLRRLPIPLITFDVYDQFIEAGQMGGEQAKAKAMVAAVNEIPRAHRDCLQFLVFHLSRVIQRADDNLMTPLNLAVVFAPTIMRPMDIQRELTDTIHQRTAVQTLLENHKFIFGNEE
ncbi:rho-type GTPase-activating protein-like protein 2 [Lindgomyces ingoldianus]|uniref:Rho-type GTPase-activating protein-like protein 2 n=1 Tax=Lindgomyces ingoldianus TaxID=673940 RepID=A0ACB6R1I6_9PLEO|nr:rho-type GTPase-activating protein-like protein 2 [Lindgomyces ingoldianus]KAF2472907.1 rho-type GTPase-activating protein-like protein 2 [Lindgomyces ingoldianus]